MIILQDSKAQVTAIHLIVRTLQRINVFGVENRDTLTHKATGVLTFSAGAFSFYEISSQLDSLVTSTQQGF